MAFPELERYLARLHATPGAGTRVWTDAEGRAQGRFFNSTLTSAFQAIRDLVSGAIVGHEGFARSYSERDQGLCIWKLLDHAASDDESVELDRLCRMLHAINFFRQPQAAGGELYLSVHARLLAAVDGNHGMAFRRILNQLSLPQERVVLQLPLVADHQGWLVNYVADNYRRNGFRIAVNAADAADALALVRRVRPDVVKVPAAGVVRHETVAAALLAECAQRGVTVIFKRVETAATHALLQRFAEGGTGRVRAQSFLWDLPQATLAVRSRSTLMPPVSDRALAAGAA